MRNATNSLDLSKTRQVLWIAVCVAALLSIAFYLLWMPAQPTGELISANKPSITNSFEMTSHTGQKFTQQNIVGKPTLIFFGFLSCPDVCPTTLNDISGWLEALGSDADRMNTIYVSVDPARDTPQLMADYLSSFDKRIIGLTGPEDELQKLTKPLGVFYKKEPNGDDDYTINHTASVLLLDKSGMLSRTIDYHEKRSIAVKKIRLSLR